MATEAGEGLVVNFPAMYPGIFDVAQGADSTSGEGLGQAAEGGGPTPTGVSCLQVITPSDRSDSEAERLHKTLLTLNGSAKRSAFALQQDAIAIVNQWGVEKTGFLTLTFGGGVSSPTVKHAQKCFDSMLTNFLGDLFAGGIKVLERGKRNGRVHFHCLVDSGIDIRSGADFDALKRGDNSSLNPACRSIWVQLRSRVSQYGFGAVVEFMPVRTSDEGIARYVCKYIAKHVWQRRPDDVGARFKSYWGNARAKRICSCQFSWGGEHARGAWLWRRKLAEFSVINGIYCTDEWKVRLGSHWAFHLRDYIFAHPLTRWPSFAHFSADRSAVNDYEQRQSEIRHRDPELLPLAIFRENEVLRVDDSFALVELSVLRTVVRRLVATDRPNQGDRAWVNELKAALDLGESVHCAMAEQDELSSGLTGHNRTIYIMLSPDVMANRRVMLFLAK